MGLGGNRGKKEEDKHVEDLVRTFFVHKLCKKSTTQVGSHRVMGSVYETPEQIHCHVAALGLQLHAVELLPTIRQIWVACVVNFFPCLSTLFKLIE